MSETIIKMRPATDNKNADGHLGKICNNCAGFGYTLGIAGTDHGCKDCGQTGVASMSNAELQAQLVELTQQFTDLKNIIIKNIGDKK